ncbi:hypothetical protein [Bacillus cereus]|uniref:hypothetical protein n=1 Tax=Bacillus cereus TaxID=1396 RepID=UPI0007AB5C66|nr:hypothetical protein [Bacillus cereus]HDR8323405.1 hypothetical protein [Bacillus cereus]HDR8329610.1 hypothetical protein [Bacillus cereus]HDR8336300.1 hypothetical protein [Bacillus cereus]
MNILNQDVLTFLETLNSKGINVTPLEIEDSIVIPFYQDYEERSLSCNVVFPNIMSTGARVSWIHSIGLFPLSEGRYEEALEIVNELNRTTQLVSFYASPKEIDAKTENLYSIFNPEDLLLSLYDFLTKTEEAYKEIEREFLTI